MTRTSSLASLLCCALAFLLLYSPAEAGDTLNRIKLRGKLNCGVSEGVSGFSEKNERGEWSGIDVDFCRALGAAVLGDPGKVELHPLNTAARFPALLGGSVDVLTRNTTWTLEREATLGVLFAGVLFYDEQGFLVRTESPYRKVADLDGSTVCVVKATTHQNGLAGYFGYRGMKCTPVTFDTDVQAIEGFFAGRCQAYTSELSRLKSAQRKAPGGPGEVRVLSDTISKEPMGPAVLSDDHKWFVTVRWVLFALIRAEELGITRANARARLDDTENLGIGRWHELDGIISKALGISPGWATRALTSVGNYGEMYERNFGPGGAVELDRGANRLWEDGGMMFAPPFR